MNLKKLFFLYFLGGSSLCLNSAWSLSEKHMNFCHESLSIQVCVWLQKSNHWSLSPFSIPSNYFISVSLCLSMWVSIMLIPFFSFVHASIVWNICFSLPAKIPPITLKSQWQSTIRMYFLYIYKLVGRSTDFSWAQWGSSASSSPAWLGWLLTLPCTSGQLQQCHSMCVAFGGPGWRRQQLSGDYRGSRG